MGKVNNESDSHTMLQSNFPVLLPYCPELYKSDVDFGKYIISLPSKRVGEFRTGKDEEKSGKKRQRDPWTPLTDEVAPENSRKSPFMDALSRSQARHADGESLAMEGKMLTQNGDVAHSTTKSALVDAFDELQENLDGDRIRILLNASWHEDPLTTLRILFNARSIHLGKSSRRLAYKAFGWLYEEHPKTFLTNLVWLVRPVIEKKVERKGCGTKESVSTEDDEDFVAIEKELVETSTTQKLTGENSHDVRNGVSHGFWKDLLNILSLAARGELRASGDIAAVLNPPKEKPLRGPPNPNTDQLKLPKATLIKEQHGRVVDKLANDPWYRALHLTIARLFASQLRQDCLRLTGNEREKSLITLAAKWAPSPKEAHDRHTFIVSSIAELLYDCESICPEVAKSDREQYLKYARNAYRGLTLSPLRKQLELVERNITAGTFGDINYEKLPSVALRTHQKTFFRKDLDHFSQYIENVARGEGRVSGATLLPAEMVHEALGVSMRSSQKGVGIVKHELQEKLTDGQWKTLVQRIRDSGTLKSAIAVCDVSGSMSSPTFSDKTCPMDSSIGLSLLLAEVCKPPFGGGFISFSENPTFHKVGGPEDSRSFWEKVKYLSQSPWGGSTDFVAVFEQLLLPMAKENKLKQEDMVKQVFVFSDMEFNAAQRAYPHLGRGDSGSSRWTTSYERIQKSFRDAGYEMPLLIFWNLAGGRATKTPKPVTINDVGTALVSGYSQGQLKMFLEGGNFEEPKEGLEEAEMILSDGETITSVAVKEETKMDPLSTVMKAVSHPAYSMLQVVD